MTITATIDTTTSYGTVPKKGLKFYSPNMAVYWPDTSKTDVNGRTFRQLILDLDVDTICQSELDHTTADWAAIRDLNLWLADQTGCYCSPHFQINTSVAGSPIAGTYTNNNNASGGPSNSATGATTSSGGVAANYAPEAIWTKILTYISHFTGLGMSLPQAFAKLLDCEITNEPQSLTFVQQSTNRALYQDDSNAAGRFIAVQSRRYANYFESQFTGFRAKMLSGCYAVGGDPVLDYVSGGTNNTPFYADEWMNGFRQGDGDWPFGAPGTDPNTKYCGYSNHGYMGLGANAGAGGIASSAGGPVANMFPFIFYEPGVEVQTGTFTAGSAVVTSMANTSKFTVGTVIAIDNLDGAWPANAGQVKVTAKTSSTITMSTTAQKSGTQTLTALVTDSRSNWLSRSQWKQAQRKLKAMQIANTPGGYPVLLFGNTEQWPWSDNIHDGKEGLSEIAMYMAACQMGVADVYYFAGGFVASAAETGSSSWPASVGSPKGGSATQPNDAYFGDYGGHYRKVLRYQVPKMCWSRNDPQLLCPVTVTGSPQIVGDYDNPIDAIQVAAVKSSDGVHSSVQIANFDLSASHAVTIDWQRTLSSGTPPAAKGFTQSTAFDADLSTSSPSIDGGGTSTTITLSAGQALRIDVVMTGGVSGTVPGNIIPPGVSGTAQVGATLSDTAADTWTGSPSSKARIWQQADDAAFTTGVTALSSTSTTQVLPAGALAKYVREGVKAHNATGDSTYAYSNVVGPITAAAIVGDNDDFTRSNEDPLSQSGAWSGPMQNGQLQLTLVSNKCRTKSDTTSQSYRPSVSEANSDRLCKVSTLPGGGTSVALWQRIQNPGNASTAAGYLFVYTVGTGFRIFKMLTGGSFTQLGSTDTSHTLANGEVLRFTVNGTGLTGYWGTDNGGGSYTWHSVLSQTDSSITGAGYDGMEMNDGTGRVSYYGNVPTSGTPPTVSVDPTITGNAYEGSTLTCTSGTVSGGSLTSRQWKEETAAGSGIYANISGQTGTTYAPVEADYNLRVLCAVLYTGTDSTTLTVNTAPTLPVVVKPDVVSVPTLDGEPVVGDTFTISHGSYTHAPDSSLYTYRWYQANSSGGSPSLISGETSQSYVNRSGDIGHTVIGKETPINAAGSGTEQATVHSSVITAAGSSIASFTDPFTSGIDGAKWTTRTDSGTTASSAGRKITLGFGSADDVIVELQSIASYDLTGHAVSVQFQAAGDRDDSSVYAWLQLNRNDDESIGVYVNQRTMRPYQYAGGVFSWLAAPKRWIPGFLQIREASGTLYFEWSALYSGLSSPLLLGSATTPFGVTKLQVRIGTQKGQAA